MKLIRNSIIHLLYWSFLIYRISKTIFILSNFDRTLAVNFIHFFWIIFLENCKMGISIKHKIHDHTAGARTYVDNKLLFWHFWGTRFLVVLKLIYDAIREKRPKILRKGERLNKNKTKLEVTENESGEFPSISIRCLWV